MKKTLEEKIERLKAFLFPLPAEKKYEAIIEAGRKLKPLAPEYHTPDKKVAGCQSVLYLHSELQEGKVFFSVSGDALISKGLAALLIEIFDGESPETVMKSNIAFLKQWGIDGALSMGRSNGLYQIHLRMKQDALKFLIQL